MEKTRPPFLHTDLVAFVGSKQLIIERVIWKPWKSNHHFLNVLVCEPPFFIVKVCYHPKRNLDSFRWWLTSRENRKGTDNSAVGPLKTYGWVEARSASSLAGLVALVRWEWLFFTRIGKSLNGPIQKLARGACEIVSGPPLWIWLHWLFGILFFGVSNFKNATWGVSKTNWTNVISTSYH